MNETIVCYIPHVLQTSLKTWNLRVLIYHPSRGHTGGGMALSCDLIASGWYLESINIEMHCHS